MDISYIAKNIKRFRMAKGLSQAALATAANISLPGLKRLENNDGSPRMGTLQAVAAALEVNFSELLTPVRELKCVRFRARKKLNSREKVLADVSRWLDDFNWLENSLNDRKQFLFTGLINGMHEFPPLDRAGKAAFEARKKLKLGDGELIRDICGLLGFAGIKVFPITVANDMFFGLSVSDCDGGPAVIVNTWDRISVERRIFTAAHELGHLILHLDSYDVNQITEDPSQEKEADRFAGQFLMPDAVFKKEWDETKGSPLLDRVFKVKRIFKVSYKTVLYRLSELGLADKKIWIRFSAIYQQRYGKSLNSKTEPFPISETEAPEELRAYEPEELRPADFMEDRLGRLVNDALDKGLISMSRAAEILNVSLSEIRERFQGMVGAE